MFDSLLDRPFDRPLDRPFEVVEGLIVNETSFRKEVDAAAVQMNLPTSNTPQLEVRL
jgi:hypothetical protein